MNNYILIVNGAWYYFNSTTELFRAWQDLGGSMWNLTGFKQLAA